MLNYLRPAALIAAALVLSGSTAQAATTGAIAQTYTSGSGDIVSGTMVSLTGTGTVKPASPGDTTLVGVATSQPVLQLTADGTGTIQVAIGGTAQVLVSDINGPVKAGDHIAASPLSGIGMKALQSGDVVGTAGSDLAAAKTTTRTVADSAGHPTAVKVGLVPVAVNVEHYSAAAANALSAFVPSFLQDVANAIAGKPVSPVRVLLALALMLLGFITVIIVLNAAIRNGLIAIGRNPLAGTALRRGLVDVLLTAVGLLLVTGVIIYAVLAG
jgi:hypothetical protein